MATSNVFLILSERYFDETNDGTYGTGAINCPGAIEVLEFGFNIEQIGSEEGGRPRSVEKVVRSDVKIRKAVDSRSPLLFKYCCQGTHLGFAEIQCFGPDPSVPYLVYRLQFVHVSSYSPSGGGDVPTEEIGLRFGEMGVRWNDAGIGMAKQGNTKTGTLHSNWSWVMQWPITLGDPLASIQNSGQQHTDKA
ncbi:MAG: type VI secretion system tube protein Hcp [Rubinisphaera brasiliensis]|uniref:Type VI secretion system effector, Hcp1 family n=1 Tax=Rubinisphaera brasiliensis (strain ATCC 49424 / DSM 5305 / JCM 21570 / IAM 15109 / NBRC 103401 / IFAM 1448) TaxID=756272 RepID=F0SFF1_RUBBR|nr:type VI secretion system tube protein Hcp [Rubinisphaera brasiliensis]ADY59358.1 protein of unknown function DUF796 [Rubinisphaera brasiliensis DSM 5305]MBB03091.1 Hcp1 family type VI secretion system effector [Planctomyces sp.]MBR9803895.1 type VI secretion system tube protein Hcp [bacterium]